MTPAASLLGSIAAMSAASPSGEQFELEFGDQRAVVTEVGAGLRTYRVASVDVVDAYGEDEMSSSGRGQVLIPWPNRLEDGTYEFEGRTHRLPLTEPEHGNAIHGLVRWVSWSAHEWAASRIALRLMLHPQPGYPFSLELEVEYSLSDAGLAVRTTATNVGEEACPYGSGAHPYLKPGPRLIDGVSEHVPASRVLRTDERGLPTGDEPVEGTPFDFRRPRAIGPTQLDNAFTGLERDDDGLARVKLDDPTGVALTLWLDGAYRYVTLYSGDARPDVARRSIAVEPMTCPANAFRTGVDVIRLEPGVSSTGRWGIAVTNR
jgi:aldose 1-epimerase